jgi:hypothetical protein
MQNTPRRPRRPLTGSAGSPSKSQVDKERLADGDGKIGDGKIDWVYHITIDILETAIYIYNKLSIKIIKLLFFLALLGIDIQQFSHL